MAKRFGRPMRFLAPLSFLAALVACSRPPSAPPDDEPSTATESAQAWTSLATNLPGRWHARVGDKTIDVEYRLTARDSVLLETWMPGTAAETLTTYHRDGANLMLTHYCGQGNQPQLRLAGSLAGEFRFAQFAVTDFQRDESALSELGLTFANGILIRDEVYALGSETERTTLEFVRVP